MSNFHFYEPKHSKIMIAFVFWITINIPITILMIPFYAMAMYLPEKSNVVDCDINSAI